MENILEAFSDIAEVLPRLDRLKATFQDDMGFHQVVGLIYHDIVDFLQRSYKFFRRKAWHVWFAFDWGLFERRFKSIIQRLTSHCDLLDREAAAVHFSEMKKFRDKRLLEDEAFERQRQNQMAKDVFGWLSAAEDEQEEFLHRLSDDRQPGTCNWVLADDQIQSWINGDGGDATLWMTGIPGAGKSFLCSLLIQNLQTRQDRSSLYYFCGRQSDTCAVILRTLAFQLLQQNLDMTALIHQAYLLKGSSRSAPAIKKMLGDILPTVKVTQIVIDGVDECDDETQHNVLKILQDIQKDAGKNGRLLVSSREVPRVRRSLLAQWHMQLGEKTSEGLKLYIKEKLRDLETAFPMIEPRLKDLVQYRLESKAKGMFLWVRLVLVMLMEQGSEAELENAIDQLPEGLDAAYRVITSRIKSLSPRERKRAFKILFWVCTVYRPVKIHEVADGIVLHPGQTTLSKKTRSPNFKKDLDLCAPLLEVSSTGVLSVVHFSAKEYLVHSQSGPFLEIAEAHFNVAMSCVINLTTCLDLVPKHDGIAEKDLEARVVTGSYGLQSYAHAFWVEHLLEYLGGISCVSSKAIELIALVENLCQVRKRQTVDEVSISPKSITNTMALGLNKIQRFPRVISLVSRWLHFKSNMHEAMSNFDSVDAQQQWKLQADETYLSLIENRLLDFIKRILMMDPSALPLHIEESEYVNFISRLNFPCRFRECNHSYYAMKDRDAHEISHMPSFPCLQCDFAERGFRSRKDLEKHTRKYHMSAEDFEIPSDLYATGDRPNRGQDMTSGIFFAPSRRSRCWNEQGRKVLRRGLGQVLAKFESELTSTLKNLKQQCPANPTSGKAPDRKVTESVITKSLSQDLDNIRGKIEGKLYDTLTDFKYDLHELSKVPAIDLGYKEYVEIESTCDRELEKAVSGFGAFADFGQTRFRSENRTPLATQRSRTPEELENFEGPATSLTDSGAASLGGRTPYWSSAEEREFPWLLEQYGRDFAKIADYLKTKTVDEAGQHFNDLLSSGREDLLEIADSADSRLWQESQVHESNEESEFATTANMTLEHEFNTDSVGLPQSTPPLEAKNESVSHLRDLPLTEYMGSSSIGELCSAPSSATPGVATAEPKKYKRRPRQRALCPYPDCMMNKDGLRDEYALQRHITRFHTPTRKIWVCEDISVDRNFLAKCKACSAKKHYSSEGLARKHLCKEHFNTETPLDSLRRWMRELEEPNPKFQNKNLTAQVAISEISPTAGHKSKRRKTEGKSVSLPPVLSAPNTSNFLPSMMDGVYHRKGSSPMSSLTSPTGSGNDKDSSDDGDESEDDKDSPCCSISNTERSDKIVLLPDVSFDIFLPGQPSSTRLFDNDGPPHQSNRALIKPDQVPRLPHLPPPRKRACQDQVDALYQNLDKLAVGSVGYQEQLELLASLSRRLMADLRDGRRRQTLAPSIPVSI